MLTFNHEERHRYDDIIGLPHHVSKTHPQMPLSARAAQFAPFAALTAHGEAVKETARLTDERIELDEDCRAALDLKLLQIYRQQDTHPSATITYFVPDRQKTGGVYVEAVGRVKKIDEYERAVILTDGTKIPADEIIDIVL